MSRQRNTCIIVLSFVFLILAASLSADLVPPAPPVISRPTGAYAEAQHVSVTCVSGTTIKYTMDGSEPGTSSPSTTSGHIFTISATTTLRAKAYKSGYPLSDTTTAVYTFRAPLALCVRPDGDDAASGLTWESAKRTVQGAVNAAVPGDEVWVKAGTYAETISLANGVKLYGGFAGAETVRDQRNWHKNQTIVQGLPSARTITAAQGAAASTMVDGFTIKTVNTGIYCNGSAVTARNNTITGSGYGVYASNAPEAVEVTGNIISVSGTGVYVATNAVLASANVSGNTMAGCGGGINLIHSAAVVRSNIIAFGSRGIYCYHPDSLSVAYNCVYGNTSYDYKAIYPYIYNGYVYDVEQPMPRYGEVNADPLFADRAAGNFHLQVDSPCVDAGYGGGFPTGALDMDCQPRMQDFPGKGLSGVWMDIGADECYQVQTPVLSPEGGDLGGGQQYVGVHCLTRGAVIHYTRNGADPTECDPMPGGLWGDTIAVERNTTIKVRAFHPDYAPSEVATAVYRVVLMPATCTLESGTYAESQKAMIYASGAYYAQPAIHYTTNGADPTESDPVIANYATLTIDKTATLKIRRFLDGCEPSPVRTYRYDFRDPHVLHVSDAGDDRNPGLAWDQSKRTVSGAILDSVPGDQIWVRAGTYVENVQFGRGRKLYGGFNGTETDLFQRSPRLNETILDGGKHGSVVAVTGGAGSACVIDGFTIRNGLANYAAGGIDSTGSVIISNNLISGNVGSSGGGISLHTGASAVLNNVIAGNVAGLYGGAGIRCSTPLASIVNNTIVGNTFDPSQSGTDGAVCIYTSDGQVPVFANNILAYNQAGIVHLPYTISAAPGFGNNCVFGNMLYDYFQIPAGYGDLDVAPLFRDATNGDFHLEWDSPCVDRANDLALQADFLGMPRPVDGNLDGQAVPDIGAFEFVPMAVQVDALPGDSENTFKPQPKKMLMMVILGTDSFDVLSIDPASIVFGPLGAREVHERGHREDVNGDRIPDLLLHFQFEDTGVQPGTSTVYLIGRLISGEPFIGSDTLTVSGAPGRSGKH